jgi:GNAT superfamily N-acetyltransferase
MDLHSLEDCWLIATNLGFAVPALHALKRLGYVDHFYCLSGVIQRLRFPRLRSDIHVQEATEADFAEILRGLGRLDAASRKEVVTRLLFHRRNVPGCHVGRNEQGDIVSMQWLIRPQDGHALGRHARRLYYPLSKHEVMLENIFVFPSFRGMGVFATVNHGLLERARSEGFHACNTYVRKDNVESLNGFLDLGFRIRKLLTGYNVAGMSWRTL